MSATLVWKLVLVQEIRTSTVKITKIIFISFAANYFHINSTSMDFASQDSLFVARSLNTDTDTCYMSVSSTMLFLYSFYTDRFCQVDCTNAVSAFWRIVKLIISHVV